MDHRIYLDHAATTPLNPRVLDAMLPVLTQAWGNPSSVYAEAREARRHLDAARRSVAESLRARPQEIVFTSGGSESDSLALRGIGHAARDRGDHVITAATEHHAVLHTAAALEREGFHVMVLPVDGEGFVDPEALEAAVDERTSLVSIMLANNESGTIQPIAQLAQRAKAKNPRLLFHTDAVQAAGMMELDVQRLGVDALSLAAHKFYGPKGAGVLYVRAGTPLEAQILGGSQERERRAGTESIAGAAGLAAALRLACEEMPRRVAHLLPLRDRLLDELPQRIAGTILTGPRDRSLRLANSVSCCFEGIDSETLLLQLDLAGIAASSGSACSTGSLEPSHVLTAMGLPDTIARGSLRLSLGTANTAEEIETVLELLPEFVERLRTSASPAAGRAR